MSEEIVPFVIDVPETVLANLRDRLARTRWADRETVGDWSQGVPLDRLRALCEYWATSYDWRRCEARLNGLGQSRTMIDGLNIHFLHVRSRHPQAKPLILTHGWPGSVVEFLDVIGPLTDPEAHGGTAADAFHVVLPSLPGFGFSDKPAGGDWTLDRIASAWATLMERLGYPRFLAQGGDWGAFVTTTIGATQAARCAGIHINSVLAFPDQQDMEQLTPAESAALETAKAFEADGSGYFWIQSTRPQTLAYGLNDSPAGQAAWIYEKLHAWTDHEGEPESILSRDAMLDNIMLYWLPQAAGSSARIYWNNAASIFGLSAAKVSLPAAMSLFPKEMMRPSRRWAERVFAEIVYWNDAERGGHFAAFEQPAIFVREVRAGFSTMAVNASPPAPSRASAGSA